VLSLPEYHERFAGAHPSTAAFKLLSQRKNPRHCLSYSIWQNFVHVDSCRHSAARIRRVCGHRRALSARK
jgi:hypothetical protein